MVSHDLGEVFRNCPQVCVIDRGHSEPAISTATLFQAPPTEASARLAGCRTFISCIPVRSGLNIPDWGMTIPSKKEYRRLGVPSSAVQISPAAFSDSVPFIVQHAVRDIGTTRLVLSPAGSVTPSALLRFSRADAFEERLPMPGEVLHISIDPEKILYYD